MDNFNSTWEKIYRSRDISYRYYKKLKEEPRDILDEVNLLPEIKLFTLKLYRLGLSMKKSLEISNNRYDDYISWCLQRKIFKKIEKEKYALKELKFRGFIPLENLIDYNPKKYDYIVSNQTLEGKIYIYPKRYGKNYKSMKKGYEDIHKEFPLIGLEGWTKIQYTDGYKG